MPSEKSTDVKPILRWVGGKGQLLGWIRLFLPQTFNKYYEPFFGGGALCFSLKPSVAYLSDLNDELIMTYEVVRDDYDALIEELKAKKTDKDSFLAIRNIDRDHIAYSNLSKVQKAARFIYLNKTCFNGYYRVNSKGGFNTPYANIRNPNIADETALMAMSSYLNQEGIALSKADFESALSTAGQGDFVYLDPPYDPLEDKKIFNGYNSSAFTWEDQKRLLNVCRELDARGVHFMLSNSYTPGLVDLYKDQGFTLLIVTARRSINSKVHHRGPVPEIILINYKI